MNFSLAKRVSNPRVIVVYYRKIHETGVRKILCIKWEIASQQSVGEAQLLQEIGSGEGAVAGAIGGSSMGTVAVWFARTVAGAVVFGVIGALS